MNKYLVLLFFVTISCKYTQICEITPSTTGIKTDQFYYFENDSVHIKYSFWGESGGVIAYSFTNKLNIPLYIDWKKCSFVKNGVKYDYWEDVTISKSITKSTWYYLGNFNFTNYTELQVKKEQSLKPERITFLAPNSTIIRVWNSVYPTQTGGISKKYCEIPVNNSNRIKKVKCQEYSSANTFLRFRNFMTISTTEKFEKEIYIDNEFFVSKVFQMEANSFDPFWYKKPTSFYIK